MDGRLEKRRVRALRVDRCRAKRAGLRQKPALLLGEPCVDDKDRLEVSGEAKRVHERHRPEEYLLLAIVTYVTPGSASCDRATVRGTAVSAADRPPARGTSGSLVASIQHSLSGSWCSCCVCEVRSRQLLSTLSLGSSSAPVSQVWCGRSPMNRYGGPDREALAHEMAVEIVPEKQREPPGLRGGQGRDRRT